MNTILRLNSSHHHGKQKSIYILVIMLLMSVLFFSINAQTPVDRYGRLKVVGNKVVSAGSDEISLAGNSLFWSNWGEGAPFYNSRTVNHLAGSSWNASIVRAAMGVEDENGYNWRGHDPNIEYNKVRAVVNAARNAGIYVIIDFHSHYASSREIVTVDDVDNYHQNRISNRQAAREFFERAAREFGGEEHVIFEIFNEPIDQSWSTIKSYANEIIPIIRRHSQNLILVGTPNYSQEVDVASRNPITGNNAKNVAYTLHFYSGTHQQWLRDKAVTALNNGIAIFVSEWGAVDADGDGSAKKAETERWMTFLRNNKISHANYSISDKAEGASVVAPGKGVNGFTRNNLSNTGRYVRDIIKNWNSQAGNPPGEGGTKTYRFRARGDSGNERLRLSIGGKTVKTVTLKRWYKTFQVRSNASGTPRISFINDNPGLDAEVDWLRIDNRTFQAENQLTNTSVYQNGSCGGSYSQYMDCGGYIDFVTSSNSLTSSIPDTRLPTAPQESDIVVFPNPSSNFVTISTRYSTDELGTLIISDVLGRTLRNEDLRKSQQVDITNLPPGLYVAQIRINGKVIRKKLIKR